MLSDTQISVFKSAVTSLNNLAEELVIMSDRLGMVGVEINNFSEQIQAVLDELNKPDYLDKCPVGDLVRKIIANKPVSVDVIQAKELKKYIVIKCISIGYKKGNPAVKFEKIGTNDRTIWENTVFTGISAKDFKPNQYYIIVDEPPAPKKHNWKYVHWLSEQEANRIKVELQRYTALCRGGE